MNQSKKIPLLFFLIFSLAGWGGAAPGSPCDCSAHDFQAGQNPAPKPADCCEKPALPVAADCPCGDNCPAAFQAPAKDLIVLASGKAPIPSLESGHSLPPLFGSLPSERGLFDRTFPFHDPPSSPLYLNQSSWRC